MYFTDQLQRQLFIPNVPQRIISLVPSQTELLIDLGLEDRLVGVTKFCIHPKDLRSSKTIVGGTKNYRMEVIEALKPDLIIGNREENEQQGIEALMSRFPVWMSDIVNLADSLEMIRKIGEITAVQESAVDLANRIEDSFSFPLEKKGSCLYLIWANPSMVAGKYTFIDQMLFYAGFENVIRSARYPVLSEEEMIQLNPDYVLLSSEPYPFKEADLAQFQKMLPEAKIRLVDGEMFSWYGSRLRFSMEYFRKGIS